MQEETVTTSKIVFLLNQGQRVIVTTKLYAYEVTGINLAGNITVKSGGFLLPQEVTNVYELL